MVYSNHSNEQHGFHKNNPCKTQLLQNVNELSTFLNSGHLLFKSL